VICSAREQYYELNHGKRDNKKDKIKKRRLKMSSKKITKDTVIGDVINDPEARKVIEKYFGNGCFTCPGIKMESIAFGAMMHNVDPEKVVKEINEAGGA
jgi:hybrid cluster-associated redox disulfide protein